VSPWFWSWIVLVVVFALGEAVTGGFFVLPWAFGAGVAALIDWLGAPVGWQWVAFVGVSSALLVAVQRHLRSRE
jgi:membrane protein implicated in regulation of membrane protease activity